LSGPILTYQQHVRYLAKINCTNSPKNRFLTDLKKAILEWQAEGDMVILIADMNKDVRLPKIQKLLRPIGLVDGPTMQHRSPPATHNRGSLLIDGIFLPITLVDQCKLGYLEIGDAIPSNHRALWLDILAHYVCPLEKEAIERPMVRCLHCKDPQVVTRYNELLWELLQLSNLAWQASALAKQTSIRMTSYQQREYESINKAATEFKCNEENNCRKIKAGAVPWCPQVSKAINQILYRKGLQSWLKGCKIGSSVLWQQAKKGSIINHQDNFLLDNSTIQEKIWAVYKSFHQVKANPDHWDTWIANFIQAQAQAKGKLTNHFGNNTDKKGKKHSPTSLISFTDKHKIQCTTGSHWVNNRRSLTGILIQIPVRKGMSWWGQSLILASEWHSPTTKPYDPMVRGNRHQVLLGKFHHEIGNPYMEKLLQHKKKPEQVHKFVPWLLKDYTNCNDRSQTHKSWVKVESVKSIHCESDWLSDWELQWLDDN